MYMRTFYGPEKMVITHLKDMFNELINLNKPEFHNLMEKILQAEFLFVVSNTILEKKVFVTSYYKNLIFI